MKKMVCEICGSQSIKKDNGVFVCQECGTEYSLEDAKKLLKEIEEVSNVEIVENKSNKVNELNNKSSDIERIKLEYDLLCWHNFYEKCHELENSFEIKDDKINLSPQQDITERKLSWNNNETLYYNNIVVPRVKNKYRYSNDIREKEKKYIEDIKKNNELYEKEKIKIDKKIKNESNIGFISLIIGGLLFGVSLILFGEVGKIGLLTLALAIACFVCFGILTTKKCPLKYEKKEIDLDYGEKLVISSVEYRQSLEKSLKKFSSACYTRKKYINDNIPMLCEIKNNLKQNIQIPEKYVSEDKVNALLSLVLNKRADTLKEAINLYETEAYRETVVSSLNLLNYNISQLNNNIMQLRKEVNDLTNITYQGLSTLIQQNNMISSQLESIKYDTSYLAVDSFLD